MFEDRMQMERTMPHWFRFVFEEKENVVMDEVAKLIADKQLNWTPSQLYCFENNDGTGFVMRVERASKEDAKLLSKHIHKIIAAEDLDDNKISIYLNGDYAGPDNYELNVECNKAKELFKKYHVEYELKGIQGTTLERKELHETTWETAENIVELSTYSCVEDVISDTREYDKDTIEKIKSLITKRQEDLVNMIEVEENGTVGLTLKCRYHELKLLLDSFATEL